MGKTVTTRYDVAEHLRTPEEMAAYLEACLEEADGDAAFVAKALGDIARAKGMTQVARDAGLSRESLYKALSGERTPNFDTILKVIRALGLSLHAEAGRGRWSRGLRHRLTTRLPPALTSFAPESTARRPRRQPLRRYTPEPTWWMD